MKTFQRLVWAEGMLVAPQHFQQLDAYHEDLVDERLRALVPHAWGVLQLEMDTAALGDNQVALRSVRVVFPGGAVVALEAGARELPRARALPATFSAATPSLDVFLALPVERRSARNFGAADGASPSRFAVHERNVVDCVSGAETSMQFAQRNLSIVFAGEDRTDLESVRIARIVRTPQGGHAYAEDMVPAALRVRAAKALHDGAERILAAAVAKQRVLGAERRMRDSTAAEYHGADITRFLLLHALNGTIPLLRHACEAEDFSPYALYTLLLRMGGELCTFSAADDPTGFPAYVHADLQLTFEPLFAKLLGLLQANVSGAAMRVPLEARADGLHLGRLSDAKLHEANVRFVLAVYSKLPEAQVAQQLPRLAKVGSWANIAGLVSSATAGAPLRSERPPKEIPIKPEHSYFTVDTDNLHWKDALRERAVAVHLPPPFEPQSVRVELYAVERG